MGGPVIDESPLWGAPWTQPPDPIPAAPLPLSPGCSLPWWTGPSSPRQPVYTGPWASRPLLPESGQGTALPVPSQPDSTCVFKHLSPFRGSDAEVEGVGLIRTRGTGGGQQGGGLHQTDSVCWAMEETTMGLGCGERGGRLDLVGLSRSYPQSHRQELKEFTRVW